MEYLIENLSKLLEETEKLPGQEAQKLMAPSLRSFKPPKGIKPMMSSVLISLFIEENNISTLFIKRSNRGGKHRGQMAFPGGKKETYDKNEIETALREAYEEVGILPNNVKILGRLSDLYVPVSNFMIVPIVGFIRNKAEFVINKEEVTEIKIVPLPELFSMRNKKSTIKLIKQKNIKVPYYSVNNCEIWGATAMIISELEILMKRHYLLSHELKINS